MNQRQHKSVLSRRQLLALTGSAGAALALAPFVPLLEGDAVAQTAPKRRYLFWYEPTMPSSRLTLELYQTSPGPLNFRGAFTPLNAVKEHIVQVRNLNNLASKENRMDGGHTSSGITQLSGWPIVNVAGTSFSNLQSGKGLSHSTLDQWMASRITDTPLPHLLYRYPAEGNFFADNVWRSISSKDGLFVPYLESPGAVYDKLSALTGTPEPDPSRARQSLVLDRVYRSVERVRDRVSAADRPRIEAHLDAIRSIEARLDQEPIACELEAPGARDPNLLEQAQDLYIDLVAAAFSCGLTRVAGAMFHTHQSIYSYDSLGHDVGSNFHRSTHGDGPGTTAQKEAYLRDVMDLRARQFRKLIETLAATPDAAGGSVLDTTICHFTSEVGGDHAWDDLPALVTSGGYFRGGQMRNAQSNRTGTNAPMNRLHTSIARAMGFDIEHFGDPSYGSGELASDFLL